jgi:isocitrate lyase
MSQWRTAQQIEQAWASDPRWQGIHRSYTASDVVRLRGTVHIEHSLARMGAERLWHLMATQAPVRALGALTGNQAVQQVSAGLTGIYLSGWQVAADANSAGQMYPDQSLYPVTACRRWSDASTRLSSAPTRSTRWRAAAARPTGSRPSSRTPKPVSAATSTRSS